MTSEQKRAIAIAKARQRMQQAQQQAAPAPQQAQAPKERGFIDRAADTASMLLNGVTAGYSDEIQALMAKHLLGIGDYDQNIDQSRKRTEEFRQANPIVAPALEVAGGVATALTPIGAIGQAASAPMKAGNLARAAGAGAGWGAAYGFGEGEGGFQNRAANIPVNAAIGLFGGVAGNALQAGAGWALRALRGPNKTRAANMGMQPETYRLARTAAQSADADIPGGAAAYLRKGGPDAMLGDVMPGQLDFATNVGAGAPIARRNLNARVDRASQQVTQAMDDVLGTPEGARGVARDISRGTADARRATYDAAYARPIDYASDAGREIEAVLGRVPNRTLKGAIDEANEAMTFAGAKNQQILVDIADDGAITFREKPNVQQLDEIKKALQSLARENVDQFGRPTAAGARSAQLAHDLRDTLGKAVPEYNAATLAGADKIAQDQALDLGMNLLKPSLTKEMASEAAARLKTPAEKQRVAQGVRSYLDEMLGNMRMARTDPNLDQREAWQAIQRTLTRNNKDKVASVLGAKESAALFRELEAAARAFNVRASAAGNSATAGRQAFGEQFKAAASRGRVDPGMGTRSVIDEAGSLINPARIANFVTGRTPAKIAGRQDAMSRELAELLTGKTGQDAIDAFAQLVATGKVNLNDQGRLLRMLSGGARFGTPAAIGQRQ